MARYRGPIVKQSRREGAVLHPKVNLERRKNPPGQHGKRVRKASEYQVQLREKQKVKRYYGVLERQFRNIYDKAVSSKGVTGEILLQLLERRLDNTVYRMGLAASRPQARQMVVHGHFLVNGKKLDIPSAIVNEGDVITVKVKDGKPPAVVAAAMEAAAQQGYPSWVKVNPQELRGTVVRLPERGDVTEPEIQERLIVEFYSR